MIWDNDFAVSILPILFQGFWMTIQITFWGFLISLGVGLVVSVIRFLKIPIVSRLFDFYVSFIRGTPLLVQAYIAYFVLPSFGLVYDTLPTGIVVLGINYRDRKST